MEVNNDDQHQQQEQSETIKHELAENQTDQQITQTIQDQNQIESSPKSSNTNENADMKSDITTSNSVTRQEINDKGITNQHISSKLDQLIEASQLMIEDLNDEKLVNLLKSLNENDLIVFDQYKNNDFNTITNRVDLLKEIIERYSDNKGDQQMTDSNADSDANGANVSTASNSASVSAKNANRPGPDEAKLKEILERTGYPHEVSVGQRKYGGPPPGWTGPQPGNGCECFAGKLPKEIFEDALIPLFEQYGKIWDLRIMIEPSTGFNKGYAFITYCDKESAKKAADALNGYEIMSGKQIKVNISIANVRLFIGNIPKTKSKDELKEEFSKVVEGLNEVIIYQPAEENNDKLKNRGFCFLDFDSHKSASTSRRKLMQSRIKIFNRDIAVDWADPADEPDEETMSKVKVLYIRNLSAEITEEDVKNKFETYGSIERVRKLKDYAFVHYNERESAIKAMDDLNGQIFGKHNLEISLARPLSDKKKQAQQKREEKKKTDWVPQNNSNNRINRNNNIRNNTVGGGSGGGGASVASAGGGGGGAGNSGGINRNANSFTNDNFNNESFFNMMSNFMRTFGYNSTDDPEQLAMQFAAFASNSANVGDMPNMNMNNRNNRQNNRNNNNKISNNNNNVNRKNNNANNNMNKNNNYNNNTNKNPKMKQGGPQLQGGNGAGMASGGGGAGNINGAGMNKNQAYNQFGKRKGEQNFVNRNKKGRFGSNNNNMNNNNNLNNINNINQIPNSTNNTNNNNLFDDSNNSTNGQFQYSGNQPIAQQPLGAESQSQWYQDTFYASQWN